MPLPAICAMPPQANAGAPVKDKDRKVQPFIKFARGLQDKLPDLNDQNEVKRVTQQLESQINTIRACTLKNPGTRRHEHLDAAGIALWNLCIHLRRRDDCEAAPPFRKILIFSRVYAFLMLALAQWGDHNTPGDMIRLGNVAIKTGRLCMGKLQMLVSVVHAQEADIIAEDGEHEFSLLALQKAADYIGLFQKMHDKLSADEFNAYKRVESEYFILRTALSWKEGRLDIAEHMYAKAGPLRQNLGPAHAETLADTLFEIGKDLLSKQDFPLAVKWLERAYEFLNSQELEKLSRDAVELRLSISQAFVQALIGLGTPEGFERAESHVGYVESELGDQLVVLLLRLEILIKTPSELFDSSGYADVLRRMIRSLEISDSNFKLIIHHIRKLDNKSPSQACQVLDEFFRSRIVLSNRDDWIEKAVVLRTYISTNRRDTPETVQGMKEVLNLIQANTDKPLAAKAALAILTLLWKRVDSNYTQNQLEMAESWCQVAMHPLLEQSGPFNKAKIVRKIFLCALQRNNLDAAREVFQSMNDTTKNQPMTMYLAYKLALRAGDREMASEYIELVSASSPKDPKFLYACCLDAQKSGDKLCALEALRHLARKHEFGQQSNLHIPALLRVIVRLQVSLLCDDKQTDVNRDSIVDDLCQVFETVVATVQRDLRDKDGSKLFSVDELNWFCKNAYNLGLNHTSSWNLRQVIRMFTACIIIIGYYPKDLPSHDIGDLSLRGMFCNFMIASALVALARSEDNVEARLQHYLTMRKHIQGFDIELEGRLGSLDKESRRDLESKMGALLVFDFEGAASLKNWDDLVIIARKAGGCKDLQTLYALADCMLRAESPPVQVLYSTLRTIINEIWKIEKFQLEKFAKYLRCLLQATLSHDTETPLKIVEETMQRAKEAAENKKPFPADELEWFATTAYNHGVDLYKSHEDDLCKRWIGHALSLAHLHADGGMLEKSIQDHYTHLNWD